VAIDGCSGFSDDQAYRAMDFLLDALGEIAGEIFASVATLLNLELDLVFVDTTSTYWQVDVADELADLPDPLVDDDGTSRPVEQGRREFGHSKDHRSDLPQVVIAMAVTRDGVPVRCWTFPGNGSDQRIIRTVKADLAGWNLHRLVWVADRGIASAANRAYLTRGGGHYIDAEKLRAANAEAAAALARPGRYRTVARNLRVKEVAVAPGGHGDGDQGARTQRFVVCHNPEQAVRDAAVRDRLVAHLQELIAGSDAWSGRRRDELVGSLRTKPGLRRYLRRTKTGLLRVDHTQVKAEAHLDGKWLLRTSDVTLTAEDLAAAHKQLLAVLAGGTSRPTSTCARCTTAARTASAPTCSCAGWPCCWSASPRPATPPAPGGASARNCRPCRSGPSPATPDTSTSAPSSPPPNATPSPDSTCPNRRSSYTWPPPAAEPRARGVCRHHTQSILPTNPQVSHTFMPTKIAQLRNSGHTVCVNPACWRESTGRSSTSFDLGEASRVEANLR
jgi:hypothetical protein